MERGINTGYVDKYMKPIHVDDIVQHRLGKFSKASSGLKNSRVIDFHGKFHIVAESVTDTRYGGSSLTEHMSEHLVVLHCYHMPS